MRTSSALLLRSFRQCTFATPVTTPVQQQLFRGLQQQANEAANASKSSAGAPDSFPDLSTHFRADASQAAKQIAENLTPAQRVFLVSALREHTKPEQLNDDYVEELYRSASEQGLISKGKFKDMFLAHVLLANNRSTAAPSSSALWMVFLASAIPFVAFGFLDNAIMLTVGEEIDAVFGARLGLTTLASAGLGNLVADVIGVTAAKAIEQGVKTLPFIKDPKLSAAQKRMTIVRLSGTSGSLIGVCIGCCLGLTPLIASGHFFRS